MADFEGTACGKDESACRRKQDKRDWSYCSVHIPIQSRFISHDEAIVNWMSRQVLGREMRERGDCPLIS